MNKDLDERLVPNGEYIDAVNIQVSTSEDSEVGTAQNILGNYLIPGQSYFARNDTGNYQELFRPLNDEFRDYKCVGVISDEPKDKIYFFVTYCQPLPLLNGSFKNSFKNWTTSNAFSHNLKLGAVGIINQTGDLSQSNFELSNGKTYEIFYDITQTSSNSDLLLLKLEDSAGTIATQSVELKNHDTNRPNSFSTKFKKEGDSDTFKISKQAGYDGAISNLEIYEVRSSRIIEYDTVTKEIIPIFVDEKNDVLNFKPNNIITGINIIDDLLFWTDNYGEPKKISIQRSKKGTNYKANNFQHTQLVHDTLQNGLQNGSLQDIEEKHITVIKPSPKSCLNYTYETSTSEGGTIGSSGLPMVNAGIFRITSQDQTVTENLSSLRTFEEFNSSTVTSQIMTDFSSGFSALGHKFYLYVESDINGNSGFHLNATPGDIFRLKAFDIDPIDGGTYSLDQPALPLNDWSIKAKVLNTGTLSPSDIQDELNPNPNFTEAYGSNTKPEGYSSLASTGTGYFVYDAPNNNMIINTPPGAGVYPKFITPNLGNIVMANSYTVTITVSNYTAGQLYARLILDSSEWTGNAAKFYRLDNYGDLIEGNGVFVYNIPQNATITSTNSSLNSIENKVYITPGNTQGFVGTVESISIIDNSVDNALIPLEIVATQGSFPTVPSGLSELPCVIELDQESEKPFENKFPRFSYRWRYADGEYSTIAPFTSVIFHPGGFSYHPKKGYNLGMQNNIKSISLSNWLADCPQDVIEVELLYRDEVSPNIYIVDTLTRTGQNRFLSGMFSGNTATGVYTVKTETLKSALPLDQVLRSWDAVPKKALAQDITGNRIVYGNYFQGYNLDSLNNKIGVNEYNPDLNFTVISEDLDVSDPAVPSIKSLREYQLGVVFVDKYGRETPVISNSTLYDSVEKSRAKNKNKFRISFTNDHYPKNMEYMKFFIKESSGEYYNMAMDRWYDAGDENVWISFPSSEINKINIDSYLILKKGLESHQQVVQKAKYKVLAIENEPPEEIKFKKLKFETKNHNTSAGPTNQIFTSDINDAPTSNTNTFKLRYAPFYDSTGRALNDITDDLYVEFENPSLNIYSKRYKISSVTTDYDGTSATVSTSTYSFSISKVFDSDVDFIVNNSNLANASSIVEGIVVSFYKYTIEDNNEFAGRFFVKINNDDIFHTEIAVKNADEENYRVATSKKLYFMNGSNHNFNHNGYWTGQDLSDHTEQCVYNNEAKYVNVSRYGGSLPAYDYSALSSPDIVFPWIDGENWTTPDSSLAPSSGSNGNQAGGGWLIKQANNHFGRFAPFFRNYKYANNNSSLHVSSYSANNTARADDDADAGIGGGFTQQTSSGLACANYKFGYDSNNWAFELAYITTGMNTVYQGYYVENDGDVKYVVSGSGPGISGTSTFTHGVDDKNRVKYADNQWKDIAERNQNNFDHLDRQLTGDVWFVDKGKYVGRRLDANDSLHFGYLNMDHGTETGIDTSSGSITIAVGGLYDSKVVTKTANSIAGMFAVGYTNLTNSDLNPEYDHETTRDLVAKFYPGSRFRWKDDPNKEVYTIIPGTSNKRLLRAMATEWPYITNWGGDHPNNVSFGAGIAIDTEDYHGNLTNAVAQLSPNNTRGWKLKYENSSGGSAMLWDPTNGGTLGAIANGLYLPCPGSQIHQFVDYDSHIILTLNSLTCTDPIFGERDITVGMIITSYNDGNVTLDNSSTNRYQNQELLVYDIAPNGSRFNLRLVGYRAPLTQTTHNPGDTYFSTSCDVHAHTHFSTTAIDVTEQIVFEQAAMNGLSQYSENRLNAADYVGNGSEALTNSCIGAVGYRIEFLEDLEVESKMPENPAIWETEPTETTTDVDLYYEASGAIPFVLNQNNWRLIAPSGSIVEHVGNAASVDLESNTILQFGYRDPNNEISEGLGQNETPSSSGSALSGYWIQIGVQGIAAGQGTGSGGAGQTAAGEPPIVSFSSTGQFISVGDKLKITQPNGFSVEVKVLGFYDPFTVNSSGNRRFYKFFIDPNIYANGISSELSWHNCYSFGNGVESNRIRDTFNFTKILNGVKVSTTFDPYREEHRKHGLIYSGIYNSVSGSNNLNQFISANKITKDINPIYGSIQKLHARDTDLVTLCEDKVLKILSNKDAVFNADGNPQLTANENVLGQAVPFVGEYGISTNPESFASESYRVYFADKVRGAIIRLSRDGITPISDHGMKDWFRDNLKLNKTIVGSYDDKKDEYNITLEQTTDEVANRLYGGITASFKEDVKGWVSFKSFVPEQAVSCANEYYTFKQGKIYHHHNENSLRNTFYLDYAEVQLVGPHPNTNYEFGYYAWFSAETLIKKYSNGFVAMGGSSTDYKTKIKQYRKGELIYHGVIDIFGAYSSNNLRNENGERLAHCRRGEDTGASSYGATSAGNNISQEDQWRVGDIIIFDNISNDSVTNLDQSTIANKYGESSINLLLNQDPGVVKTFHTLDYEGSQAKTTGLKKVQVVEEKYHDTTAGFADGTHFYINPENEDLFLDIIKPDYNVPGSNNNYVRSTVNVKQYRVPAYTGGYLGGQTLGPVLIREGLVRYYHNIGTPNGMWDSGTAENDWKIGDIITTELEEKSVNVFDYIEKDGWYVEDIKTNKQEGSLIEFLNKEGKWFNNIKGKNHQNVEEIDLKSANVQGVGIISDYTYETGYLPNNENKITIHFENDINTSLQVGDKLYSERTTSTLGPEILPPLEQGNYIAKSTEISYGTNLDGTPNITLKTTPTSLGSPPNENPAVESLKFDLEHTKIYQLKITFGSFNNNVGNLTPSYTAGDRYFIYGTGYAPTYTPSAAPFGLVDIPANKTNIRNFTYNKNDNNGSLENFLRFELKPGYNVPPTYKELTIERLSLKEVIPGNSFGLTQIKADELFYLGKVISFTNKTITVATVETSAATWLNDYVMFVKPEVINTSSLVGYFADVNIKNNSLVKAELFSVGSEVTESSR